jgi:type IV pilus modification protein PilV
MRGLQTDCRGMALMEVTVAGFLLSVGLMALLQIQLAALRQVQESGLRQQASWLAEDLVERLRVSPHGFTLTGFSAEHGVTVVSCQLPAGCSPEQFILAELSAWQLMVHRALPEPDVYLQAIAGSADTSRWLLRIIWHTSSVSQTAQFESEFVL